MSSHHFVREGQEPALFIIDTPVFEDVDGLLQWSPYILVVEASLEKVLSWGIRVDGVLVNNVGKENSEDHPSHIQDVERVLIDGPGDLLGPGLQYLALQGETAVNVFCDSLASFVRATDGKPPMLKVVVHCNSTRWIEIRYSFEKWVASNTLFYLWKPFGATDITVEGGTVSDEQVTAHGGWIRFTADKPFWLGEDVK